MDTTSTDTTSADATTATMDAAADNAVATPTGEPSQPTTQIAETPAATEPPATPPDASAAQAGSSTTNTQRNPNPVPPTPPAASQPAAVDWEKRYQDAQSYIGRLDRERSELRKYRESWGDLDPRQVRETMDQQRRAAEVQQVKPWHPSHPDFIKNENRMARVQGYMAARDVVTSDPNLDDGAKRARLTQLAEKMGVTNEDAQLYREHQSYVQDAHQAFARDPGAFIQSHVERIVRSHLGHYDQTLRAQAGVDQWMQDPKHKEILEHHADDVMRVMSDQTPRRQIGIEYAAMKAEIGALKAQLGRQRETVETAQAQQTAVKKRATVSRDSVSGTAGSGDPVAEAAKQGLTGAALAQFLSEKRRAEQ